MKHHLDNGAVAIPPTGRQIAVFYEGDRVSRGSPHTSPFLFQSKSATFCTAGQAGHVVSVHYNVVSFVLSLQLIEM